MLEKHLYLKDQKIAYLKDGTQGPALILLHGFPDTSSIWKNIIADLKDQYILIAIDLPGFGKSSPLLTPDNLSFEFIREMIKSVVNKESIGEISLVGHDWGGMYCTYFAQNESIKSFISINSPHPKLLLNLIENDDDQAARSQYMKFFLKDYASQKIREKKFETLKYILFDDITKLATSVKEEYLSLWKEPQYLEGILSIYRQVAHFKEMAWIKVKVPTLYIWSEKDHALSIKNIHDLNMFYLNITVKILQKNNHWSIHQDSLLISNTIKKFL